MPAPRGRSETRQTPPGARPNRRAQPRFAGGRGALPSPRVGCMSRRATGGPRWMTVAAAQAAVQNSAYRPPRWRLTRSHARTRPLSAYRRRGCTQFCIRLGPSTPASSARRPRADGDRLHTGTSLRSAPAHHARVSLQVRPTVHRRGLRMQPFSLGAGMKGWDPTSRSTFNVSRGSKAKRARRVAPAREDVLKEPARWPRWAHSRP